MKVVYISTYPPRQCGIGTFTENLVNAMYTRARKIDEVIVVAINNCEMEYDYPDEVKFIIQEKDQTDYLKAAEFINKSGADACILQHEFGIYGGTDGIYILSLLHRLKIPIISTLHTVLKKPSYNEKTIIKELGRRSEKIVIMSEKAFQFLRKIYGIPSQKIKIIEHGVPDLHYNRTSSREELDVSSRKMMLTFGFVGRNKGIETVIKVLPRIIEKHQEVLYVILGKTHPNVLRESGEEYREYLQELAETLKVSKHITMINEFVDEKKLFKYLTSCDIYLTPYPGVAQSTSGTLAYAMGAGCAVVSTPYWHATELLRKNRGCLFDFNDCDELTDTLNELLEKPAKLHKIQENAYRYGQQITWPKIGTHYTNLLVDTLAHIKVLTPPQKRIIDPQLLPPFSLDHIKRMTDKTGIMQHATFGIPNFEKGYCLDDNARGLLMTCLCYNEKKDSEALTLMTIYLSYIRYMQNEDGSFRNFLHFDRTFVDKIGSEDAFGRAIWALGYLLAHAPKDTYYQVGKIIFQKAVPHIHKIESPRAMAYTMIGVAYYLKLHITDDRLKQELRRMAHRLIANYKQNQRENWEWYESFLAYDNAILPLAMLHAGEILNDRAINRVAFSTMGFLSDLTLKEGHLSLIGNKGWYIKGQRPAKFDQQPLDALSMVLMFDQAYRLTRDQVFHKKLFTSFLWFLGENDIRMNLYNQNTGGCCDGIEKEGVNRNQGAESSLAYLIAYLTVLKAYRTSFPQMGKQLPAGLNRNHRSKSVKRHAEVLKKSPYRKKESPALKN